MTADPRVAAVVLTYDGRDLALQAIASLGEMTGPAFDTILVDNGSSDGTAAAVAAAFPDVAVVRTEENLGAAGGYNLGFGTALDRGYDYLLVLNNDIAVHPAMLAELLAVAERDPRIGCVGPKTYDFWDRRRLASAGGILRFRESVTCERGQGELDHGQYDRDEEVAYLNGCGMLIRREALAAAGLWDPVFHLSVEDADWCTRARRAGFSCWYAHRAILYHMVSQATGVYRAAKTYHTGRSTALFVRRYANTWQWLSFLAFTAAALPGAYARELPRRNQGAVVAKARGILAGLRAPLAPPPGYEPGREDAALSAAVS